MPKTATQAQATTWDRIRVHGLAGMTYDDIINHFLDAINEDHDAAAFFRALAPFEPRPPRRTTRRQRPRVTAFFSPAPSRTS